MTIKEIEILKKLKNNEIIELEGISIKKDRGQYNITKDKFTKTFKDEEFSMMCEKLDQLIKKSAPTEERLSYEIPGTKLIVLKNAKGYDVYSNGKLLQKNLLQEDLDNYVLEYKKQVESEKLETIRNKVMKETKMTKQKKVLYYFTLVLSVILLSATYIFGVRFDGVSINRTNQNLYEIIEEIAAKKYPEQKSDDFDAVYYTLNYYAHRQNYLMTETYFIAGDAQNTPINNVCYLPQTEIYKYYSDNNLSMNLVDDHSYSGAEFNMLFKDIYGNYFPKEIIIKTIGCIINNEDIKTVEELASAYISWDDKDIRSNRAYNWEVVNVDGISTFDRNVTYFTTYLSRNPFVKLFLSDSSNFINEYHMFQSIGWLTWVSMIILMLYIILAFSIWVFKRDNLKISKFLVVVIITTSSLLITPLILQYFFEGLDKSATQFLDVVENTRFTTTSIVMNLLFNYIMKFSNIVLTGILTIALPLKVIRYFVLNAVQKLDTNNKITETLIKSGVVNKISDNITSADWRL
jgi:hypothetical protein